MGGVDIRQLSLKALRREIAVILQDNVLFSGTIASNLRFGRTDADGELMARTLEEAAAAELLTLSPEGLEAPVAQRGQNLSGGQKQRLTIARALIKSPKILIMDDATSALDFATEARLQQKLRCLLYTSFYFACDQIILPYEYANYLLAYSFGVMSMKHFIQLTGTKMIVGTIFLILIMFPYWKLIGIF